MKRLILVVGIILIATMAQAQCVAEVTDVTQDPIRGSIIVHQEYVLNGVVVQQGKTRYLETSGTEDEIIQKAKDDGVIHCGNLVKRIEVNANYLKSEKLKHQKTLTVDLVSSIKSKMVGYKSSPVTEATEKFKGKDIKVTYDSQNTTTNSIIVPE